MLRDILTIPATLGGWPLFGWSGLAVIAWLVIGVISVVRAFRRGGDWLGNTITFTAGAVLLAVAIPFALDSQGRLPIRGFGLAVLVGILAGNGLATARARAFGIDPEVIFPLTMWTVAGGFLGARAFYVIQYWSPQFWTGEWGTTLARVANITQGGIVVYGGILAGILVIVLYCRRHQLSTLNMCDLIAPSLGIGLFFGRLGCLANGCCFAGVECEWPWAVRFPAGSPPFVRQVEEGKIPLPTALLGMELPANAALPAVIQRIEPGSYADELGLRPGDRIQQLAGLPVRNTSDALGVLLALRPGDQTTLWVADRETPYTWGPPDDAPRSRPVHPVQLYSSINGLLLGLLLLAYSPYRRRAGEVTALLLTAYPVIRFVEEAIRTDEKSIGGTGLSISQNISLLILLGVAGLWVYLLRSPGRAGEPSTGPA